MIRYALRCDQGHDFDGWFRSSDGFEAMRDAGQVGCAVCGATKVDRALMAPAVSDKTLTAPRNPAAAASQSRGVGLQAFVSSFIACASHDSSCPGLTRASTTCSKAAKTWMAGIPGEDALRAFARP